jgi:hypothetical protein
MGLVDGKVAPAGGAGADRDARTPSRLASEGQTGLAQLDRAAVERDDRHHLAGNIVK